MEAEKASQIFAFPVNYSDFRWVLALNKLSDLPDCCGTTYTRGRKYKATPENLWSIAHILLTACFSERFVAIFIKGTTITTVLACEEDVL